MYTGEVVTQIWRRHELFLLPYPAFLVGHVPVELPEFTRLVETSFTILGKLSEFFIGVLECVDTVLDQFWVTWSVSCNGEFENCILVHMINLKLKF